MDFAINGWDGLQYRLKKLAVFRPNKRGLDLIRLHRIPWFGWRTAIIINGLVPKLGNMSGFKKTSHEDTKPQRILTLRIALCLRAFV